MADPTKVAAAKDAARTTSNRTGASVGPASELPTPTTKKAKIESYDIARSDETLDLAKDLAKFIKDNKLSTTVQGKEFVNVEGWQYAGSRLGIVPVVEHVINVGSEAELKYQAKVTLWDLRSQHTVGAGFAVCSDKESGKKFYQEFAIMSMAQTRAIGKAYRNLLAWIIRAAGYEPTPAEEMDYNTNAPVSTSPPLATAILGTEGNLPANPTTGSADASRSALPAASATSAPSSAPVMTASPGGDPLATAPAPVQYCTASQKEHIIRLLNHPVITRQEKTKMLLNINRLDEPRADEAIAKLRKAIDEREGGGSWQQRLHRAATQYQQELGTHKAQEYAALAHLTTATDEELQDALHELYALLGNARKPAA